MKNIAHRTVAQASLALLLLGAATVSQAQVTTDRKVGQIFAAVGDGHYQVWDFSGTPTLVETITNGALTDSNAGCAFDAMSHPFTTDLTANDFFKDRIDDPQNVFQTISVTPAGGAAPTSIVFDSLGNSYVGVAAGNGLIEEYDPSGNLVRTLPVGATNLKDGSPWMDLSTDAQTIYFTNLSNTITQFIVSSSKTSKFATISGATLHALRVLPAATQTATGGLLLVAAVVTGSSNIQLLNSAGLTIKTYSVPGENNIQVLTLDPNGTSFWAGDLSTHDFFRINLATGAIEKGPVNTGVGSGPNGLCAYGGFSAAQPQPTTLTASLTPSLSTANSTCTVPSATNTMDCTFSTVVPPPATAEACPPNNNTTTAKNCFTITLNGIHLTDVPNGLQLVYNYSQIPQSAGTSDTGLACELSSPDGTKCEVHSVSLTPDNGPIVNGEPNPSIYQGFDVAIASVQHFLDPRALKNESELIADFRITDQEVDAGSDTTTSIFTLNEQPLQATGSGHSCGYISPVINAQFNKGRTIPFKFQAVADSNPCATGPFLANLNPRLVLLQFTGLSTTGAVPHPVPYSLSNGTPCPVTGCFFRLDPSTNTWILNVDSSTLQGGGTEYFGTTFDDSNHIPPFSNTLSGVTDIFSVN